MRTILAVASSLVVAGAVSAMDGISVTTLDRQEIYSGVQTLNAYTITNDAVTDSAVLASFTNGNDEWASGNTPSLDPGGSYVVFQRRHEARYPAPRHTDYFLSIAPVAGGGYKDICQLRASAGSIWWLHDGTIVFWPGDCYLHKLSIVKSGSTVSVYEKKFASFGFSPEGTYVDIDMTASRIAYRCQTACFGATGTGTYAAGPIPDDISVHMGPAAPEYWDPNGCGNALSPLGEYTAIFQGSGHEVCVFLDFQSHAKLFTFNNRDTLRNWCPDAMADKSWWNFPGGSDQGYSVNSRKWSVVCLLSPDRARNNRSDQFLINWQERKAINVTKTMVSGDSAYASCGDLWVSSLADVDPALWTHVANRATSAAYWKSIYDALPATAGYSDTTKWEQTPVVPLRDGSHRIARAGGLVQQGTTFRLRTYGPYVARIHGADGRCIMRRNGVGEFFSLPQDAGLSGVVQISIEQQGNTETRHTVVSR